MKTIYKAFQATGESFFRVYDTEGVTVVMTANVGPTDAETGFVPVAPVWSNCGAVGSAAFNDAIEAVRVAAASPNLRNFS